MFQFDKSNLKNILTLKMTLKPQKLENDKWTDKALQIYTNKEIYLQKMIQLKTKRRCSQFIDYFM